MASANHALLDVLYAKKMLKERGELVIDVKKEW
jgi:hypothetical protein